MVNVEDPLADRLRDDVTDGAVALGPVASHDQEDGQRRAHAEETIQLGR